MDDPSESAPASSQPAVGGWAGVRAMRGSAAVALLFLLDEVLAARLSARLAAEGYRPLTASSVTSAKAIAAIQPPVLLVISDELASGGGLELAGQIKRALPEDHTPPILILVAEQVDAGRVVQALREGADDYVAASGEDDAVLLARIEAAMRRRRKRPRSAAGEPEDAEYAIHVGAITIQPWAFSVLVEGERVDLTVTQFRLLLLLAQQPGRVVRPEEIQQYLAERGSKLRSSSIKSHVYFLRQKLGKAGDQIENVRRVGYRLKEH